MKTYHFLMFLVLLGFAGCTYDPHIRVPFFVNSPGMIDFSQYSRLDYQDLDLVFANKTYDPVPDMRNFFQDDFAKAIGIPVVLKQAEIPAESRALLLNGSLQVTIKTRSMIRDKTNEQGKKVKDFVQIENWEMKLDIRITDQAAGKILLQKTFTNQIAELDPAKSAFNFKSLFTNCSDQLLRSVSVQTHREERFLIIKGN